MERARESNLPIHRTERPAPTAHSCRAVRAPEPSSPRLRRTRDSAGARPDAGGPAANYTWRARSVPGRLSGLPAREPRSFQRQDHPTADTFWLRAPRFHLPDTRPPKESGVGHAKRTPLKASASKAWKMCKRIWIAGKRAGPTLAFTEPQSGKSRRCSPKSVLHCFGCLSNLSVITNTASEPCTWIVAWKSRPPTIVRRLAGSAGVFRSSGMTLLFVC